MATSSPMIPRRTAAASFSRWLRWPLAVLLVAGVLLIAQPQPARATTGDFEVGAGVGADGAAYLVRGGLQTCDSTNHCSGGLTQPKTVVGGPDHHHRQHDPGHRWRRRHYLRYGHHRPAQRR